MTKRSEEQAAVLAATEPRFVVRAAAGSGKTSVLVDKYVQLVTEEGLTPEEIVAVTFTRKAAAEMKQRIIQRLVALGRRSEAQMAETGPIQTIHGLCERILRENALEAGLSPDFDVLDGAPHRMLVDDAVLWAIVEGLKADSPAAPLIQRLSGHVTWTARQPHAKLRETVRDFMDKARASGVRGPEWRERYGSVEAILDLWLKAALADLPPTLVEGLDPSSTWGAVLAARLKSMGSKALPWVKGQDPQGDARAAADTCALVWLGTTAWEWLDAEMRKRQEFDFVALESLAVSLIAESEVARNRVRRLCRALLVDEAQDMSPMQYRLVDTLRAPFEMMVGDPQQSIYRFRFAERGLFVERAAELPTFGLTANFRSKPGILRFVDEVFAPAWGEDHVTMALGRSDTEDPFDTGTPEVEDVELWPLPAKDTAAVAECVRELTTEFEPSQIAVLARSNDFVQDLALRLDALGVPNRPVGGSATFFTRLEVRDVANAMEAVHDPYDDFAVLSLLRSPFVGLSLDAVFWAAAHPPAIEALKQEGPWCAEDLDALSTFWPWFERVRSIAGRVPAWEVVAALLNETRYLVELARSSHSEQALANVRKLLTMAAAEPEASVREFAARMREVRSMSHREGNAPVIDREAQAVTLMSVHRAKGLEFDVVVLAETHKRWPNRTGDLAMDASAGLVVTGLGKPVSVFFKWLGSREVALSREEEMRVLYVAMTRAKNRLCVVVNEEGGSDTPASLVARAMGLPHRPRPGVRVRQTPDR